MSRVVSAVMLTSWLLFPQSDASAAPVRYLVHLHDLPQHGVAELTRDTAPDREAAMRAFQRNAMESQQRFLAGITGLDIPSSRTVPRRYWVANVVAMTLTQEQAATLAARPEVKEVVPDETIQLEPDRPAAIPKREADILQGRPAPDGDSATYGLIRLGIPEVRQAYGLTGEGVTVGILDTGFDAQHPDLAGKLAGWKDFTGEGRAEPYDDNGHGTHCAGTIGGGATSGLAIGVAPGVRFLAAKVFRRSGNATAEGILGAMEWVVDPDGDPATADGPDLVSNSWGGDPRGTFFLEATRKWVALGTFPCFAAGNSGPGSGTVGTPGGFPEAFAVGATDESDFLASFSSRGPALWNGVVLVKPDVSAPGVNVTSAEPGGGYQAMSGTSMATPHVSGVLALLHQALPGISIGQMRSLLEETSRDLGEPGKDNGFGAGRLGALAAVQRAVAAGRITGKLVDATTGGPVGGRLVIAENDLQVVADSRTGEYTVVVPPGTYTLGASAFGYVVVARTITVTARQAQEVTFALEPSARGQLTGTVVSSGGGDALAATLTVLETPLDPVTTSEDGSFALPLPSGSYRLLVTARGHEPRVTDPIDIRASGQDMVRITLDRLPGILVLADDARKGYERFYRESLGALGLRFTLLNTDTLGEGLDTALLEQYPMVVWFTGDAHDSTLRPPDQEALTQYLKAGGRLFLSGQDVGYDIKRSPFFQQVLGARFVRDACLTREVTGGGLAFMLEGGTGAGNQRHPDVLEAAGSDPFLVYGADQGVAALTGTSGPGRFVYAAFGFEGIDTEEHRKAFLKYVLNFLEHDGGPTREVRRVEIKEVLDNRTD